MVGEKTGVVMGHTSHYSNHQPLTSILINIFTVQGMQISLSYIE